MHLHCFNYLCYIRACNFQKSFAILLLSRIHLEICLHMTADCVHILENTSYDYVSDSVKQPQLIVLIDNKR